MTFNECVLECAKDKVLVAEFDRLRGTNLSLRGTGLDVQIDVASGRLEQDVAQFVQFVKDCIWDRLKADSI